MSELSLENRLLIHELIAEYSHHVDNYRAEEWADMFLEEGKILGFQPPVIGPDGFFKQVRWLKRGKTEFRHSITNIYLEAGATNEHVFACAYGLVTNWAEKPAELAMFVEYRFEFVKRGERWKIALLTAHFPYGMYDF